MRASQEMNDPWNSSTFHGVVAKVKLSTGRMVRHVVYPGVNISFQFFIKVPTLECWCCRLTAVGMSRKRELLRTLIWGWFGAANIAADSGKRAHKDPLGPWGPTLGSWAISEWMDKNWTGEGLSSYIDYHCTFANAARQVSIWGMFKGKCRWTAMLKYMFWVLFWQKKTETK